MKFKTGTLKTAALAATCLLGAWVTRAEVTQNTIDAFTLEVVIDCNGDNVPEDVLELSGQLHILMTQTTTASGHTVNTFHFQPVNISAVGTITGDTYRAVGLTRQTDASSTDQEALTYVNNFYMIGQKSGIKSLVHETFHVTVVGGQVVVQLDHATASCQ